MRYPFVGLYWRLNSSVSISSILRSWASGPPSGYWQSFSEGGSELLDPSRSHYKEFYLVVNALLDGEPVTTCTFIWVDQDFAMARGWIQGFPKKLGEVWMTRTYALACRAAPGIRDGARFGATCSARGRQISRARRPAAVARSTAPEPGRLL